MKPAKKNWVPAKQQTSDSCRTHKNILVAIPVFNEANYVDEVLRAVHEYSDNILVVNDGSTDGTSQIVKQHAYAQIISHHKNLGYGQSLIDAFNFAARHNKSWVITIDCDYQHQPSYIPRFYRQIRKNDADIISGSRYLRKIKSSQQTPPPDRLAINRKITYLLNHSLGTKLTDSFCGFKAYRVNAISRLNLTEKGYGLPLQLWIQASQAQLKIREIPVPLIYHNPARNFAGALEDPKVRFDYYIQIIQQQLHKNAAENPEKPDRTE